MANTYYNSDLTAEQIELALKAIDGVIIPANNGKILVVQDGKIKAKSAGEIGGGVVLESLNAIANGDYYPESGVDGFDEVHIAVPSQTLPSASGVSF